MVIRLAWYLLFWSILVTLVTLGSRYFVSFGKYGLLVNLVHMIHLIDMVLPILDNPTLQKTRKYLTEAEALTKILIVFKNLFLNVTEKLRVEKINLHK